MEKTICITQDGILRAIYEDESPEVEFTGAKKVERISDVFFDETGQCWLVRILIGKDAGSVFGSWPTRKEAIDWEIRYFSEKLSEII